MPDRSLIPQAYPLLMFLGAALAACADPTVPPTTASIEVTTATAGPEPDPDGYTVQLDAEPAQAIPPSGTVQYTDISPGAHTLQLAGLAPNCAVAGSNPRSVDVSAGETARISFAATCRATTGGLQVTATTSGPFSDPDGYVLTVDGTERGVLQAAGTLAVDDLAPGDHLVGLSGVASNCRVKDGASHEVTVTAGATSEVRFEVTCLATGTIRVSASTSGASLDIDGYGVYVDREVSRAIAPNGTLTFHSVTIGSHTVTLFGVADNCQVQGDDVRNVGVSAAATAEVEFAVICSPTANGTWTARAPLPSPRWGHTSAVIPNASGTTIMYSFGGVNESGAVMARVDAYSPATDSWTQRASMPAPRYLASAVGLGGNIYVLGGRNSGITNGGQTDNLMATVLVYTPSTDTWTNDEVLPMPADELVSTAIGSHLYVLYGTPTGLGGFHLYRYDPASRSWDRRADAPHSHRSGTGTVIDGKWYVIGGGDGWGVYLDVYDPSTDTWSTRSTPPSGECSITPCTHHGDPFTDWGQAVTIGGKLYFASTRATEVYDPTNDTWSLRTKPRITTRHRTSGGLVTRSGKQVILVTGGDDVGDDPEGGRRQVVSDVNEEFSE